MTIKGDYHRQKRRGIAKLFLRDFTFTELDRSNITYFDLPSRYMCLGVYIVAGSTICCIVMRIQSICVHTLAVACLLTSL